MAVGTISTHILTDIANAIRFQAGVATLYKAREMAAAVTALDGTNAGNYQAQQYKALESGILSESVFSDIADAIRGQNGSQTQSRQATWQRPFSRCRGTWDSSRERCSPRSTRWNSTTWTGGTAIPVVFPWMHGRSTLLVTHRQRLDRTTRSSCR